MNCERCGQEVKECKHDSLRLDVRFCLGNEHHMNLVCVNCHHDFGPVRELIEKAAKFDLMLAYKATHSIDDVGFFDDAIEYDLRAQVATLTRERDEIRAYASISDRQFSDMKFLFEQAKRDLEDERKTTRARIAELEKERNEARKERDKAICDAGIAKSHADYLERASEVFGVRSFVVHANGTWEWRKG
jgi:membrane-bound lytic murein transglycosylase B